MLFSIIQVVVVSLACVAASMEHLHMLQLGRYQLPAYRLWLSRSHERLLKDHVLWAFLTAILSVYLPVLLSMFLPVAETRQAVAGWALLAAFALALGHIAWRDLTAPSKRPLAFNRRIFRLMAVLLFICLAITAVLTLLLHIPPYFLFAGMPYVVLLAARIMEPYEARLSEAYLKSARTKLRGMKMLTVIGIAGSFGKTQTKFLLRDILSKKLSVLATPASFNTDLGIARCINDELTPEHRVFIVEMGASHLGDIRKLVGLTRPRYGILTGIGRQHIDTFGSVENIASTQYELMRGLPKDGFAVFGSGDDYIDRLYAKSTREKVRVALAPDDTAELWVTDMDFSAKGTSFALWSRDGDRLSCRIPLLGRFAVKDFLMAAAMARHMGMGLEEIVDAAQELTQLDHHMQLIPGGEGELNMIDDTLNEDAETAEAAMDVLARMPGRRVVVTPGVANQGGQEKEVNYALGTRMADSADTVILVGHRFFTRSIVRGLMDAGFSRESLFTAEDADAADELLQELTEPGDTVLFESSIPEYEVEEEE